MNVTERAAIWGVRRRRRLVAVGAIGLMAIGALTACQSQPGAAAFVGTTRISDSQINAQIPSLINDLKRASEQQAASSGQSAPPFDSATALSAFCGGQTGCRQSILQDLVAIDVIKRYLGDHKSDQRFSTNGDPVGQAQDKFKQSVATDKVPSNDLYFRTRLEYQAYLNQLTQNLSPAAATNAELMTMYQQIKAEGLTTATFDQVKPTIQGLQGLGQAIAATRLLSGAGKKYGVDVNPRYIPTPVAGEPNFGFQIPTLQVSDQQGGEHTILGVTTNTIDSITSMSTGGSSGNQSQPGSTAP
jgi:hypothetical protein